MRVRCTFTEELLKLPFLYEFGDLSQVEFRILMAGEGWIDLDLLGDEDKINKALNLAREKGVKVDILPASTSQEVFSPRIEMDEVSFSFVVTKNKAKREHFEMFARSCLDGFPNVTLHLDPIQGDNTCKGHVQAQTASEAMAAVALLGVTLSANKWVETFLPHRLN